MRRFLKGQSLIEYTVLIIILIAALLTMQTYMKRGIQGKWREGTDQIGEQFDPGKTSGTVVFSQHSTAVSDISMEKATVGGTPGYYTMRTDTEKATEKKTGNLTTGF